MDDSHPTPQLSTRECVWCVAGNVAGEHDRNRLDGDGGTRLFRAGAHVLLASLQHSWAILPGSYDERVRVCGLHRRSRKWLECWVPTSKVTGWRVQLEYNPAALKKLRKADWPGFRLAPDEFSWTGDRRTPDAVRALLDCLHAADRRKWATALAGRVRRHRWWAFWRWFARPAAESSGERA